MGSPLVVQRSSAFSNKLKDKEAADERLYFNKNDEKLLKGLLKKMQNQSDINKDAARI